MFAFWYQSDEGVLYVIRYTIQKMIEFPAAMAPKLISRLFDKKIPLLSHPSQRSILPKIISANLVISS